MFVFFVLPLHYYMKLIFIEPAIVARNKGIRKSIFLLSAQCWLPHFLLSFPIPHLSCETLNTAYLDLFSTLQTLSYHLLGLSPLFFIFYNSLPSVCGHKIIIYAIIYHKAFSPYVLLFLDGSIFYQLISLLILFTMTTAAKLSM